MALNVFVVTVGKYARRFYLRILTALKHDELEGNPPFRTGFVSTSRWAPTDACSPAHPQQRRLSLGLAAQSVGRGGKAVC